MMKSDDATIQLMVQVGQVLFHWLSYQHSVCETDLLAESSIRYPFVECLERKLYKQIGERKINLEYPFSCFKYKRLKVDVYFETNKGPKVYTEFKWAPKVNGKKPSESERYEIFEDIFRLYYESQEPNNRCFFVFCGEDTAFRHFFQFDPTPQEGELVAESTCTSPQEEIPNNEFKDCLSFNIGAKKKIQLTEEIKIHIAHFENKKSCINSNTKEKDLTYRLRDNKTFDPQMKIETQLLFLSASFANGNGGPQRIGIWEIKRYEDS